MLPISYSEAVQLDPRPLLTPIVLRFQCHRMHDLRHIAVFLQQKEQTWIVDAPFQEMDIETGEVLFEWSSLDHISLGESALPLPLGQAGIGHNSSTV